MNDPLAEALFHAVLRMWRQLSPALGRAVDRLRDAGRPPRGVELRSSDGSMFTGVVIVDRSEPVVMFAVRVGERVPLVTPPPLERPAYERGSQFSGQRPLHLDPDDPRWDYPDPYAPRR